ncbi:MAG: type II secretion system minor pseudopilin GspI [Arenicellales bacterium]|nr:type II secretion system minor pseudopilin GspI [Arenicellales bacterium]
MRADRGFTLLEILAALAIVIIGIAAVTKATKGAVEVLQTTEDHVLASWVASNRLAELRINRFWPSAITKDSEQDLGGRVWYYREIISETTDPDLLRVDLSVYSDENHRHLSTTLFGYLARYSPPSEPPPESDQSESPDTEQTQTDSKDASDLLNGDTSQEQAQTGQQEAAQ